MRFLRMLILVGSRLSKLTASAQGREVFGAIATTDTAVVFAEGHIQYSMQAVFDRPVMAYRLLDRAGVGRPRLKM